MYQISYFCLFTCAIKLYNNLSGDLKYSKTCLKLPLKKRHKMVFKTDYHLMQVKGIAESSKRAFCNTFFLTFIKLRFVFKTFVLYIFDRPLKTGFTVILSRELV